MTVDMIAGTPMEQEYRAKSPNPDKLQDLLDKIGAFLGAGDGLDRRRDPRHRGADPHHGRRLRHGPARPRGAVPPAPRR